MPVPSIEMQQLARAFFTEAQRDLDDAKILQDAKRMAEALSEKSILTEVVQATPHLLKFPSDRMWIDYDKEADVLYISFQKPQRAIDSELLDNGALLRYRGKQLVGVTIFEEMLNLCFDLEEEFENQGFEVSISTREK